MPFRDTIRDYSQSGRRRLEDAVELLQHPTSDSERSDADTRHLRGAMYLAGYGIEGFLKAYLIRYSNENTLGNAIETINARRRSKGLTDVENIARSSAGHRLFYMLLLTDLTTSIGYDPKIWGRVARWSSSWRYDTDSVSPTEATEFIADVQSVVNWLAPKVN